MPATSSDLPFSRVHFIGIGGAGMSGIALVLAQRGCTVTGSDLKASRYVRELEAAGIPVHLGHDAATIDEVAPEVVVISSAIPETNAELVRARELGLEVWPRAKMLAALGSGRTTIAIAGTHGKTTTSSMVATMLSRMGLDPSFLIGGIVEGFDTNGRNGQGSYFVAEADESDGSFLFLDPSIVVVTNIEPDHLDHYGSMEKLEQTFVEFMASAGPEGTVIVCGDAPHTAELARQSGTRVFTYGFAEENDIVCVPESDGSTLASACAAILPDGTRAEIKIPANPGRHNMLNATAALVVAYVAGLSAVDAAQALSEFQGVRRRFTHVGDVDGICVVDDYGHHPTEIAATLKAAKGLDFARVVVVFQPHRYTRTQALLDQFGAAFTDADYVYVTEIFSAGEMAIPGVTGKAVAQKIAEVKGADAVRFVPNRRKLITTLVDELAPGDLLITMGAGDVTTIGPDFLAERAEAADLEVDE